MRRLTTILLLLYICLAADAKLHVSRLCGDSMVLQQNSRAAIWGTADPGSSVSVSPSWAKKSYRTKAGDDGNWKIYADTPEGSYRPYEITVKGDGCTVTIKDVLVGEVWLASGQSNMEMPMRGFFNCPVEGALEHIASAPAKDRIRMFTVEKKQSYEPLTEVESQWLGAESSTIPGMSAVAFFFARKLNEMLDVPVGILSCAYGGARIESWTPKEILETYPDEDLSPENIRTTVHYRRPYLAYNAMLCPLMGYTIKGFIWYQGCSNVGRHEQIAERMDNLVRHWRKCWNDSEGALPFYMVEIAPYAGNPAAPSDKYALLREAQHDAAKLIPNCGIIVTNDIVENYERNNIHPAKKKPVGERLAYMALNRDYGFGKIACDSPEAVKAVVLGSGNEIGVELSNCWNGLNRWMEIEGLEVAGNDGRFFPVTDAVFDSKSNMLRIRTEDVPIPCEVRYGWGDFRPGNLKNVQGLPVTPFRIKLEKNTK